VQQLAHRIHTGGLPREGEFGGKRTF
jgi:hypothetical protein